MRILIRTVALALLLTTPLAADPGAAHPSAAAGSPGLRQDHRRRHPRRARLATGGRDRHLLRDLPGRQHRAEAKTVAFLDLRRHVLLHRHPRLRPRAREASAPPSATATRSSAPTDYGGVIVDTRNDRRTAMMFLANPRGIQYDALYDDGTARGHLPRLLLGRRRRRSPPTAGPPRSASRSPRCATPTAEQPTWGILLYRNYPRDRRYQFFHAARLPRGGNCFDLQLAQADRARPACRRRPLRGGALRHRPAASASRRRASAARSRARTRESDIGVDVKWTPSREQRHRRHHQPRLLADRVGRRRRSRPTSGSRSSSRRSARSSSRAWTSSTRRSRRSTPAPSPTRGWGVRDTGKLGRTTYTVLLDRGRGGWQRHHPGPDRQ